MTQPYCSTNSAMLTVPVAARILGIAPSTLYGRISRHTDGLDGTNVGGSPRVRRDRVEAVIGRPLTDADFPEVVA